MSGVRIDADALAEGSLPEQRVALSVFQLNFENNPVFEYQDVAMGRDFGLKVILGRYHESEAVFLPIFHDWPVDSRIVPGFAEQFQDREKYLALCAPDGSIVCYEVSDGYCLL
jgi:hypothetical protein